MILNGKENKENTAISFEIRIPKKKNKELLRKVPSKIYGSNFIMEKTKNIFWFVNDSEYGAIGWGIMNCSMCRLTAGVLRNCNFYGPHGPDIGGTISLCSEH